MADDAARQFSREAHATLSASDEELQSVETDALRCFARQATPGMNAATPPLVVRSEGDR
jgi:hypothetical protein